MRSSRFWKAAPLVVVGAAASTLALASGPASRATASGSRAAHHPTRLERDSQGFTQGEGVKMAATKAIEHSARVRIPRTIVLHFGVFRRQTARLASVQAGTIPPYVALSLTRQGLNVAAARYVPVGGGAWVLAGGNLVCIFDGAWAGVCGPLSTGPGAANNGGLLMTSGARTAVTSGPSANPTTGPTSSSQDSIIGLAPDGNSSVTVGFGDGSTQRVSVASNVYFASGQSPSSVTMVNAAGNFTDVTLG
jgi:hypothetical protein